MEAKRISDAELLSLTVLQLLASSPNGRAQVAEIAKKFSSFIKLPEHRLKSNEEVWDQQIRKLKLRADGFVIEVAKGLWEITITGRSHLKQKGLL
jgi:hypothetical protein